MSSSLICLFTFSLPLLAVGYWLSALIYELLVTGDRCELVGCQLPDIVISHFSIVLNSHLNYRNKIRNMKTDDLTALKNYIVSHPQESKDSAMAMKEAILASPLTYTMASGKIDTTEPLHIPKIFTAKDRKNFEEISKTIHGILVKLIQAYKEDEEVRKVFHFDERLNDLIYLEADAPAVLPMLRVDIFYDEGSGAFAFCEFNADGTSSMFECQKMAEDIMPLNYAWMAVKPDVEGPDLMKPWVEEVLDIFARSELAKSGAQPSVLITDFLENAYLPDLQAFEALFKERGIVCEIEDIRNLKFDGEKLVSTKTGTPYNVVYRRATTGDIFDHLDAVQDFIDAARAKKLVMIGSFQTQVPHSKRINHALLNPASHKYLTKEEIDFIHNHVPTTMDLSKEVLDHVCENKDKWIIKPADGYGSKGVYYGKQFDEKEWRQLLEDSIDKGYIVQEFIPHFKSENIDLIHDGDFIPYSNVTGLYIYDGKFAGVLSRLSDGEIMSSVYNRRMVPTYFEKEKFEKEKDEK